MSDPQPSDDDILQHLLESGYDPQTATMTLHEMKGESDAGMPQSLQGPTPKSMVQTLVPMLGAGVGGVGARMIAGRLIPKTAQVIGPAISAAGQAIGTYAGGRATGQSHEQALTNAEIAGGIGGLVEGGANLTTRGGAWVGGVPRATVNETLSSPARAWELARPFAQPQPSAEFNLAKDMQQRLQTNTPAPGTSSLGKKTVARVRVEGAIRRFDSDNVPQPTANEAAIGEAPSNTGSISTDRIKSRILSMIKPNSLEEGQQSVNSYLHDKAMALPDKMSAADLDQFIREHSRPIKTAFGQDQVSLPVEVKKGITSAARQVRNAALPEAKADFAKATTQLNSMRDMASKLLTKNGNVKPSAEGTFKNILKNQSTREMFRTYEDQTGNTGVLRAADDLAMKRQWSREDFGHAGYLWYLAERAFGRPGAKVAAIIGQPAGHAAAMTSAFMTAMQPTPMEQKIEQIKRPNP